MPNHGLDNQLAYGRSMTSNISRTNVKGPDRSHIKASLVAYLRRMRQATITFRWQYSAHVSARDGALAVRGTSKDVTPTRDRGRIMSTAGAVSKSFEDPVLIRSAILHFL